jgi:uncharacterized protein DUF5989
LREKGEKNLSIHGDARDFIDQAELTQPSLVREFWQWLRHNKKWWLTPIVLTLLLVGFLVILSGTAVAPFIYTLF